MEEILSLILQGCKLTRDLESNFPILTNNPILLSSSCEDILSVFTRASDRLKALTPQPPPPPELEAAVQEWLRSSYTPSMTMAVNPFQAQLFSDKNPFDVRFLTTRDAEGSSSMKSRGGAEASDAGKSPVTQQRSRKRKEGVERQTVKAAAPRTGNTEIPPDDGFTWRKYGQKEILGSKFPRSYYRCTHKSFYGCNAKKQVQRLDDDPDTFEVTYCGHHTCLMSSTAPSVLPPSAVVPTTQQEPIEVEPTQSSVRERRWQSLEFEPNTPTDLRLRMSGNFNVVGGSSSSDVAANEGQGPSHSQVGDGKEAEWPVVDLADAMFNSGSSSSSMDAIFSFMQDK
ncbi:WRKY transcription factor 55-like [Telopea speciosissima]|uniref:WRKY transcription factor 55-like n=1 Tax=Telopea speciosissima TaxID=54955 RepID=UPI001CC5BCD8|nr:WRKY transcription factor 55-like [Telopea speciosissima]